MDVTSCCCQEALNALGQKFQTLADKRLRATRRRHASLTQEQNLAGYGSMHKFYMSSPYALSLT